MMRLSRSNSFVLGWVAIVVLAASVIVAQVGHARLVAAQARKVSAQATLAHAKQVEQQALARQATIHQQSKIVDSALGMGLAPANWVEHRISLKKTNMSRAKVNQVLLNTALRENQFFDLQALDVSVLSPDEGLFDVPDASTEGILLHLEGTALTREMGGSR